LKSHNIIQAFEDKFINWSVDKEVMQGMVAKTLKISPLKILLKIS
jgi:N utilization substance protein B